VKAWILKIKNKTIANITIWSNTNKVLDQQHSSSLEVLAKGGRQTGVKPLIFAYEKKLSKRVQFLIFSCKFLWIRIDFICFVNFKIFDLREKRNIF